MPPAQRDKGDAFERRVGTLLTSEGYFVRRRVNLERHFGERLAVTDADLLVFDIGLTLDVRVAVGECKATEARGAPSAVDRMLWLTGVRRLLNADGAFLATTKEAPERIRGLATELDIEILDERDIARREAVVARRGEPPMQPDNGEAEAEQAVFTAARREEELRRLYWFVRTDLWLQTPTAALKRAMTAMRSVAARWSGGVAKEERDALQWIAEELTTGFALAATRIAGDAYRHPEEVFNAQFRERMSEGIADFAAMRKLAATVDAFVLGILREAGVPPRRGISALGAFEPQPPPYIDPLAEVIARLAQAPRAASRLPHAIDGLVRKRGGAPPPLTAQLIRQLHAFLVRQSGLPAEILQPLDLASASNDDLVPVKDQSVPNEAAADAIDAPSKDSGGGPELPPAPTGPTLFGPSGE